MIRELTAHLWQSTLFALAAGMLTLACRQNRAKVRYWLWLSASIKFLLPFALLIGLGGRLGWGPVAQRIASPDVSIAVERLALPFAEPLPIASAAPAVPAPVSWTRFAIPAVWLAGLVAIALIRLRLWLRIRAAVRASTPLDIPAAVEVRSAPGLLEPGVVGLLRPVLLLPEGIADRLTPSQLEAVLAHELCHVRRRDNLFASVHMLVEALFWFHPLVWWIGTRLVEERERACDEGVLTLGNEPRVYADAILSVCKLYVESPLQCVAGVTGADLKRRIEAIMTNRTGRGLDLARKLLLASAGVAAVAGPVAIGVLLGVGDAPLVHAQSAAIEAPPAETAVADPPPAQASPAPTPAPETKYQDRRLVALLFDFETMTPDDQARSQQSSIGFVHKMQPASLVALMATNGRGGVSVVQDFTDDQRTLEAAIQKFSPNSTGSAPNESLRLVRLETAVKMLGVLSEKKELVYFASGATRPSTPEFAQVQAVVNSAVRANVALYPVDVSAEAAQANSPQQQLDAVQTRPAGLRRRSSTAAAPTPRSTSARRIAPSPACISHTARPIRSTRAARTRSIPRCGPTTTSRDSTAAQSSASLLQAAACASCRRCRWRPSRAHRVPPPNWPRSLPGKEAAARAL